MDLQYYIISTSPQTVEEVSLYNSAYSCFKSVWGKFFTKDQLSNAFRRQKYISCIVVDEEVIGLCAYDEFNFDCLAHKDNSYFSDYPKEFYSYLHKNKIKKILTFESLTVAREYRGKIEGIRISDLLTQLSFLLSGYTDTEYIFAPVVKDNKANLLGINSGTEVLCEGMNYRGFNCDLLAHPTGGPVKVSNFMLKKILKDVWKNRVDFSLVTYPELPYVSESEAA